MTAVIYLASYALSLLGNSIAAIALPLLLLTTTGSVLGAGTLALATAVPAVLAGIIGGIVVDRIDRRIASVVSDIISAAAIAALPFVALFTDLNLGWFIALGIVGAIGDIPGMTAREAMLPAIVRASGMTSERLMGIRESIGAIVTLLGPAAAGGLMLLLEGYTVLLITAGTSAAAALLTLLLPRAAGGTPARAASRSVTTAVAELRDGLALLFRRSPFLLAVTVFNLVIVAVLGSLQGLILPAHFAFIGEPTVLGFVLSALALGLLLGSIVYSVTARIVPRRGWLVGGMLGAVIGIWLIALLPSTPLILLGGVITGVSIGPLSALLGVLMIERIPEHMRGRVMGTQNSLTFIAAPVTMFAMAALAEGTSLAVAAATIGALWTLGALVALVAPAFRRDSLASSVDDAQ